MKEEICFSDALDQYLQWAKPRIPNIEAKINSWQKSLADVIRRVFEPIKQSILSRTAPYETRCAWVLFCRWFSQDISQRHLHTWHLRHLFLYGDALDSVKIFAEFRAEIIKYLEQVPVTNLAKKSAQSLFEGINQLDELKIFSQLIYQTTGVILPTRQLDHLKAWPYPRSLFGYTIASDLKKESESYVLRLIDCLFDKLIQGNDEAVFSFFEKACGFRSLSTHLLPMKPEDFSGLAPAIHTWFFSDVVNLNGFSPKMIGAICVLNPRKMLVHADPAVALSVHWYNLLIAGCDDTVWPLPPYLLKTLHTPYAMDLRRRSLIKLPLNLTIPAPKMRQPCPEEELSSHFYWRNDDQLKWIRQGYHLVDEAGWNILWRQGITDFSAFKLDLLRSEKRKKQWVGLDLRELHPRIIQALPTCVDESPSPGLEPSYCESLTRDYKVKSHFWLAFFTAGLSLLVFYIHYRVRARLLRKLPDVVQPEIGQILSAFKRRPITRIASDYLHYRYGEQARVAGITDKQKQSLFGKLPETNAERYFNSMEYFPLFRTYRSLDCYIKRNIKGSDQDKEAYRQEIITALQGIDRWEYESTNNDDQEKKDKILTDLLCQLARSAVAHIKYEKQLFAGLFRPENYYLCRLLLQYYVPVIDYVENNKHRIKFFKNRVTSMNFGSYYTSIKCVSLMEFSLNPSRFEKIGVFFFSSVLRIVSLLKKRAARSPEIRKVLSYLGHWRFEKDKIMLVPEHMRLKSG